MSLVLTGATGVFGNTGPGTAIPVTISGLSLTGAQAADYALPTPQASTTANITGTSTTTTVYLDVGAGSPVVQASPTGTVKVFIDAGTLTAVPGVFLRPQFFVKYDPTVLSLNNGNAATGAIGSDVKLGSLFTTGRRLRWLPITL